MMLVLCLLCALILALFIGFCWAVNHWFEAVEERDDTLAEKLSLQSKYDAQRLDLALVRRQLASVTQSEVCEPRTTREPAWIND